MEKPGAHLLADQEYTAKFKANAHILEDLGLTLYTSVARVLVEFVANAYDADAKSVAISYDPDELQKARLLLKKEVELEEAHHGEGSGDPLDVRTLPDSVMIDIEDDGHGMNRGDLEAKFLIAGRRRLEEEPEAGGRTPGSRPLMGRKGLGKLAGFGVAKLITITSRGAGEPNATSVVLDFDKIVPKKLSDGIPVPLLVHDDGQGLPESGGTRVRLQRLLHAPTRNRPDTIAKELALHFARIEPSDFAIALAGDPVPPAKIDHAFAWPEPTTPKAELVTREFTTESGRKISFSYRLRFTKNKEALLAKDRGVRVYANHRLCAAASLLNANTNMHGFRMVDYLDGVVHADFIASEQVDYIATDRQGLRWDTPLLQPLFDLLSKEIKVACAKYQAERDQQVREETEQDEFTKRAFEQAGLEGRDLTLGKRIAGALAASAKEGVDSQDYKDKLPTLIEGIGHGTILTEIAKLANDPNPDLSRVATETARLTYDELGRFMSTIKGRLRAIEAMRKIVHSASFTKDENEKEIQRLLEKSPWIINPTFTQFLTADQPKRALFDNLAKELGIGAHAGDSGNDKERPDLVFLVGSVALARLVIVELKSSNLPLTGEHLLQLKRYMADARQWLQRENHPMDVQGILIGTRGPIGSKAKGIKDLAIAESESAGRPWQVKSYTQVLEDTEAAHNELLEIHDELKKAKADEYL